MRGHTPEAPLQPVLLQKARTLEHHQLLLEERVNILEQILETHPSIASLVQLEIDRRAKDTISRRDFALRGGGADVIVDFTSPTYLLPPPDLRSHEVNPPTIVLEPDITVGSCWSFSGRQGHVGISLSEHVEVADVTIDHAPAELLSEQELQKAPQEMSLWGLLDANTSSLLPTANTSSSRGSFSNLRFCTEKCFIRSLPTATGPLRFIRLADPIYNISEKHHIQTFPVYDYIKRLHLSFSTVVLQIHTNWGSNSTTSIYRIRIHS
ncbi:hypothetical protein BJ138DRAFT_1011031 [Hygrophoropsis aurantiaca]|uniref:Uncharacterized protein n=1 Tax=Hygrophoropsis aurantiaca TaxID=72124 RepID=A0ACB8A8E2_9AGAM|nr:hypothetical protein BJ138DRAFT_1011031 [Hygrophoropsis aurantiaca]